MQPIKTRKQLMAFLTLLVRHNFKDANLRWRLWLTVSFYE